MIEMSSVEHPTYKSLPDNNYVNDTYGIIWLSIQLGAGHAQDFQGKCDITNHALIII